MAELDITNLRKAFGSYLTGVTVVTARDGNGQPVGFTANSFTSVSMDPPLLLVCPSKTLSSFEAFRDCEGFAINVLAEGQEEISTRFASFKGDRFSQTFWHEDRQGLPCIDGVAAYFSCEREQVIDAGDHVILLGRIVEANCYGGRGLGYANGNYFSIRLEHDAAAATQAGTIAGIILEHDEMVLLEKTAEGMRPPQIVLQERSNVRHALAQFCSQAGLRVDVGAAYSVFDVRSTGVNHVYYQGKSMNAESGGLGTFYPLASIPEMAFVDDAHRAMMLRYVEEYRMRDFGLYIGDDSAGDVSNYK